MEVICDVFHHRGDRVSESMSPSQILDIAKLTDKYACMVAMKYIARIWVQPHLSATDMTTLRQLLVATY